MTEAKQDVIEIGRTRLQTWLREKIEGEKNLYTVKELLEEWQLRNNGNAKEGESAVTRTLKALGCRKAHDGKQVKIKGKATHLWILAASKEERDRLLALYPADLAEEYRGERSDKPF
jgi:hypothetical protein